MKIPLSALALLAAAPVIANPPLEGGKGSDVVTPISDTREDVLAAAGDAEGVARRAATILEIESFDRPLLALPPVNAIAPVSLPLSAPVALAPAPSIFVISDDDAISPLYLAGGGLLVPLFLTGLGGGGGGGAPAVTVESPITPGGPIGGSQPTDLPVVPEPATWLMLLLGFGTLGQAIRHAKSRQLLAA